MKIVFSLNVFLFAVFIMSCGEKTDMQSVSLYLNANELFSQGDFQGAAELLSRENSFPPALILRAKAQYFINDLEKAEISCRQAIKYRPGAFEPKLYLARILKEKGERENLKELIESLLSDNPQNIPLLRFAANNFIDDGNIAGAISLLDQAAQFSAESALVLLDRARIHWIAGSKNEALEDLSRARAMLPWDSHVSRSIAQLEKRIMEAQQ